MSTFLVDYPFGDRPVSGRARCDRAPQRITRRRCGEGCGWRRGPERSRKGKADALSLMAWQVGMYRGFGSNAQFLSMITLMMSLHAVDWERAIAASRKPAFDDVRHRTYGVIVIRYARLENS